MTSQSKRVLDEALLLPPTERAALVEELLSSFDFPSREEVDAFWAKEAEERIDAYERGELGATPAREVFEQIDRRQAR